MALQSLQLVMRTGPTPGKVFDLSKSEVYLGRDVNNDVVINDAEVSRKHARLTMQAGAYVLEDLGSTNGTFVNGQRLMGPHILRPGELVLFGENVSLVFEAGFDADATLVAAPGPVDTYMPDSQPAASSQPQEEPVPPAVLTPSYSGQVPPGPAESYEEAPLEEKKSNRPLILAGCGCLLVAACILLVGAYAFDALELYCTPPFSSFFSWLYTCP
jgi:predicted component of type VI protein secretion system